jgi:glycosyltransferase involved in cell wall biosynthesis
MSVVETPSRHPVQRDFLFLQSATEMGGAEIALLNLFANSAELRRRSLIVSLGFGKGDLPARLRTTGAEVVELPPARIREPTKLLRTLVSLRAIARSRGAYVLVANGAHPQIVGGLAARVSRIRSVFLVNMIHAAPIWRNDPLDALALLSPCDLMLAISRASKATLEAVRPGVESRLFYWGTPLQPVQPEEARRARAELGVADDQILVGSFGRLQRWKGQDVFIAAAEQVVRARPQTRFVVVGGSVFGLEPEYCEQLKAAVARAGIDDRVAFTGFRRDVAQLMAACDVVCHTSRTPEPFGLVIVEAMAQARAVIATRGGGASEIISSDDVGVIVPPENPAALAREVIALVDAPTRRTALGEAAVVHVRAHFSIETMAANLVGHLDGMRTQRDQVASVVGVF